MKVVKIGFLEPADLYMKPDSRAYWLFDLWQTPSSF